jgi:hypothetical protein
MTRFVPAALMVRRAGIGIAPGYFEHVLIDMIFVRMMQVTVMQIVDVVVMLDGGVAAARSMLMRMVCVFFTGHCGGFRFCVVVYTV